MASKKKLLTSVVALGTAAALTLGGIFAWQSISQTATNEASDIVNPGGRLHNDQHWVSDLVNDTNIYVENFTEKDKGEDIYARVRLSEYMEVVMNYGTDAEVVTTIAGDKEAVDAASGQSAENASQKDAFTYTYAVHDFVKDFDESDETKNPTSEFFTWQHADENTAEDDLPYYMPTFNKNKDSVKADLHGLYMDRVGGISNRGEEQYTDTPWAADATREGFEIYDGDSNTLDELENLSVDDMEMLIEGGEKAFRDAEVLKAVKLVEAKGDNAHTATKVGTTKGLISMSKWLALNGGTYSAETHGSYWVYDDSADGDGWVYWSSPIKAGKTTGLLLDGFKLNGVMDDTWYYAIDVEAQFVTANDVGKGDNSGFYADGETVTENAEELLKNIGVEIGEDDDENADTTVTIHKDDTAATTYSRAVGTYDVAAEGFTGDVTYTVTGAQRCKVTSDNKLSINKWESASSFTITAADEGGNTGTVTVTPTGTTPTDNPIFELYKVTDSGNEYMQRLTDDAVTLNVKAGEKYHISVDFAARDQIEYLFGLYDAGTNDLVDTDEITFMKKYGKDYVARVYNIGAGIFEMNIEIYEAAAGKSYELGGGGHNDDGIEGGLDITFVVAAADGNVSGEGGQTDTDTPETPDEDDKDNMATEGTTKEIALAKSTIPAQAISLADTVRLTSDGSPVETLGTVAIFGIDSERGEATIVLIEDTDYTFENGELKLKDNGAVSSGDVIVIIRDEKVSAMLLVEPLDSLTMMRTKDVTDEEPIKPIRVAHATVGKPLSIKLSDSGTLEEINFQFVYALSGSKISIDSIDYTYDSDSGEITFNNIPTTGYAFVQGYDDEDNGSAGVIYLTAAETTD